MPAFTMDRALVLLAGLAVVGLVPYAAWRTTRAALKEGGKSFVSGQVVMGGLHGGIDPLAPPGLPEGVTVDPITGRLTGLPGQPIDGATWTTWEGLEAPEEVASEAHIPSGVRALNGERVALIGFVYPAYQVRDFRKFLLVASTFTCCYGTPPGLDEMIDATIADGKPALDMDPRPIRLVGTFRVKIQRWREEDPSSPVVLIYTIEDAEASFLTGG